MAAEADNGGNSPGRLDRIEAIIEALANRQALIEDEFSRLLKAQVVTVDTVQQLAKEIGELREAQKHTDERMNALISVVDDLVRGRRLE
ncbi:MAG: hypothetical protein ACKV22_36100 [Bryobacteraceae bacterium]